MFLTDQTEEAHTRKYSNFFCRMPAVSRDRKREVMSHSEERVLVHKRVFSHVKT